MRKIIYILSFVLPLIMSAGCSMDDLASPQEGHSVVITLTEAPEVKSVLSDALLSQVSSLGLYAYNSQGQLHNFMTTNGSSMTMKFFDSETFTVYALANFPKLPDNPAIEESDFVRKAYAISHAQMKSSGIPMYGKITLTAEDIASGTATIELTRLITRVSFSIDKSELSTSNIDVTSVKLCQTACAVSPFGGSFAAREGLVDTTGDSVSSEDLATLNAGGTVWLYCLENVQGVLLPDNTDPWKKVPSEISAKKDYCTYLEVSATFRGDYEGVEVTSDKVVYRFYLGKDNVTDFTLERNHGVGVNLKVSDLGVFEREWKVDYGKSLPVVSYSLDVAPSSTNIYVYYSALLTATYTKYVDGVVSSSSNVTSGSTWTSDKPEIATVNNGTATGVKAGTATITGAYAGLSDACSITVEDLITYDYRFVISGSDYVYAGHSTDAYSVKYYTDTYTNGVLTNSGTTLSNYPSSGVSWQIVSGSQYASVGSNAKVTGVSRGTATLKASLSFSGSNYSAQKDITVHATDDVQFGTGWSDGGSIDY